MKVRYWSALTLVVVIAVVVIGAKVVRHKIRNSPKMARQVSSPIPVEIAIAKSRSLTEVIGFNGEAQPIALVNLTMDVKVRVKKVLVDIGEEVKAGQQLLSFDPDMVAALFQEAEAVRDSAVAQLESAQVKFHHLKSKYDSGVLPRVSLLRAEADITYTQGEVRRAKREFNAIETIYQEGLLPQSELEKALSKLEKAEADLAQAMENKIRTQIDLSGEMEDASARLKDAIASLATANEDLMMIQKDIGSGGLNSPVDGIVMLRQVSAEEMINTRESIVAIAQLDTILVAGTVSEMQSDTIAIGDVASILFNAFPDQIMTGEVAKIRPHIDTETRSFTVYIKLQNPRLSIKPGMSCFVRTEKSYEGLAVPSIAIIKPVKVGVKSLFVLEEKNLVRLRQVNVGVYSAGWTQIKQGLNIGDPVVVVGQLSLRDGDQVIIGPESEKRILEVSQ